MTARMRAGPPGMNGRAMTRRGSAIRRNGRRVTFIGQCYSPSRVRASHQRPLALELQPPPSSTAAGASSPEEDAEAVADVAPDDDVPAEPLELLVPLVPFVPDDEAEPEDEDDCRPADLAAGAGRRGWSQVDPHARRGVRGAVVIDHRLAVTEEARLVDPVLRLRVVRSELDDDVAAASRPRRRRRVLGGRPVGDVPGLEHRRAAEPVVLHGVSAAKQPLEDRGVGVGWRRRPGTERDAVAHAGHVTLRARRTRDEHERERDARQDQAHPRRLRDRSATSPPPSRLERVARLELAWTLQ